MYSKVNYTIVGIFVLLFGLGTVAFSFWLAKYGLHQEYDLYKTYMTESVSGLSKDSVVRLRGVDVGRVKAIRIDPDNIERVEILLNIKKGVPIKEDMVAHTSMLGVTGLLSIEIEGGSNHAKTLKPSKDHIPVIASSASWFDATKKDIGTLAERLVRLMDKTEKLLSSENIDTFGKILANTEQITGKSVSVMDELNTTLMTYQEAAKHVSSDLERMTASFETISKESVPAVKKLKETTRNFNRVTLKVEKSLDRGDYNIKKIFEPLLVDIEILSDQITALAKELDESPSDIFFKSRKRRKGPGE
ncbi:Possible ABC transport system periplasmic substrate-binding protein [hydrothermal vent metagenome]|uniref:Possible ABC transport system periplasmic substrate-binding protein n=1 Tax=hydrothermal vent metagenome TaxID=652676 RepID=A0A1W1E746_9ZZZZ